LRHLLIVNPSAGRGTGLEAAWRLERLYREAGIALEVRRTERPKHATEIARAGARRFEEIVALGGDGSLHEVVNGVAPVAAEAGGPGAVAAVGVIPLGTGNDFVKSLGVAVGLDAGFQVVREGRRRRIDLGRFRADGVDRIFVNQIQVGYGAIVVEDMERPDALVKRIFRGQAAFIAAGALHLGFKTREIEIEAHGHATRRGRFFEAHIANARFCGGGISFAPEASLEDGLFDLVTIDDLPLFRMAPILAAIRAARLRPGPGVASRRTRSVVIRDARTFPLSADGECYQVRGGTLEMEALPGALDVLAP